MNSIVIEKKSNSSRNEDNHILDIYNENNFNEDSDNSANNIEVDYNVPINILTNTDNELVFSSVSKLYNYNDIARKRTQEVIHDVSELVENIISNLKTELLKVVQKNSEVLLTTNKINETCSKYTNLFKNLKTEHSCLVAFEKSGTYIRPESYLLGERKNVITQKGQRVLKMVPVTAQFVPIRYVLQKFFEIPGGFNETLDYIKELQRDKDILSNFIQGRLWMSLLTDINDKLILPIIIYFDDYECNNPFGSHKGISKCGAIYAIIP